MTQVVSNVMSVAPVPQTPAEQRPVRAWQRMLSGRRLDLLDPDPSDVDIADIAHGLARVARWNGQTIGAHSFSVAQHTVLVERIADATSGEGWTRGWRRAALLHDAAEYVIGDLISPFKTAIGLDYKAFELRLMAAVHRRFDLPDELPPQVAARIKAADRIAAYFEATRLAGFTEDEGATYFGVPSELPVDLWAEMTRMVAWPAERAQAAFLARFRELAEPS